MTTATPLADEHSFKPLLSAVRGLVPCDAAVLLRLHEDEQSLQPVAVDGLVDEALGRRFALAAHPRLAQLMASERGQRFAADCGLPDPYDGLVSGQPELLAVHDCMGAPLRQAGRPWGLLTLDALDPRAFDGVAPAQLHTAVALLENGIAASERLRQLQALNAHEEARSREWRSAAVARRELLGRSAAMQQLKREIDTVAPSDLTVLILGETGVGKELVAQRLHARSLRAEQALVQINCAALPESLADSELFGHKKGAFTGAVQDRIGKFELADGGTLLLDEVGELPLPVQAKLLRVLQSGELQRPGSDRQRRVDVRVLAATNRDLRAEVAAGRFRADLYHRLSVYPLHVPALRERGRDVLTLAAAFLEENQHRLGARNLRLTPDASAALLAQRWPGNVRELEHLLSRAALRALSAQGRSGRWIGIGVAELGLGAEALPASAPATAASAFEQAPGPGGSGPGLRAATEDFQRRWVQAALAQHGGSWVRAAAAAGMDRSNFHRLARRLGLVVPRA